MEFTLELSHKLARRKWCLFKRTTCRCENLKKDLNSTQRKDYRTESNPLSWRKKKKRNPLNTLRLFVGFLIENSWILFHENHQFIRDIKYRRSKIASSQFSINFFFIFFEIIFSQFFTRWSSWKLLVPFVLIQMNFQLIILFWLKKASSNETNE